MSDLLAYTPELARELRGDLSQQAMADAVLLADRARWAEYERGARTPSHQTWALALIVAGRHPAYCRR